MRTNRSTRNHKIFFVSILSAIILIFSPPGFRAPLVHAQEGIPPQRKLETVTVLPETPQEQGRYYRAKTFALSDGTLVTGHTINGPSVPPSGFEMERQGVTLPQLNGITANAVPPNGGPLYLLGCSSTAAGDIIKTDERSGKFPNNYPGVLPPDGSFGTFTDNNNDTYFIQPLIATHLTMEQRWDSYQSEAPDPVPGGQDLSADQVGPLMYSSVHDLGDFDHDGIPDHNFDGDTRYFSNAGDCPSVVGVNAVCMLSRPFTTDQAAAENLPDGTYGMELFYKARGYAVSEAYNQPTDNVVVGGFSFNQFKTEIDSGRPVMIHLGGQQGTPGHSVVGVGYDATSIHIHDGWDTNTHTMPWGGSYANMPMFIVSIIHPIPPAHPGDYTISGYVGVPNATITYTGGSAKTDNDGYYSISVPPGWTGTVTPSKPGYTFNPASRSYNNIPDYQTKRSYTAAAIPNSNLIQDPSFESGFPNAYWDEFSSNFGTPLCDASCGPGARTGSVWGWFGGTQQYPNETASLSQTVTIPISSSASLDFYLWLNYAGAGSNTADVFTVKVDGTTLFSANATQLNSYSTYVPVSVDLTAYANGASHVITFGSVTTGQAIGFFLDDVSLASTPISASISGTAGVGGATLSYMQSGPQTVTADSSGNYSIGVPFGWSGTVTPSKTGYTFSPVNRSYTNVTTNKTAQNYTAVPIRYTISGNVGASGITLNYTDGTPKTATSQANGYYSFTVPYNWSGTVTPSPACFTFTPTSKNYVNVTTNQTSQNYTAVFKPASVCSNISIDIGGVNQGNYGVAPHTSTRDSYPINNGPVKATSPNAKPFLIAERDAWLLNGVVQSFSEMMGLPDNQVTDTYYFPWYNNVTMDTQLRFANLGNVSTNITVTIAGVPKPAITVPAGQSTRVSYAGINAGPVKVQSSGGVPIIVAERDAWLLNGVVQSFSEMMGFPGNKLTDTYYFPWYNNVTMDTQLRFANLGAVPTDITVTIAGVAQAPITVAAGMSTRISYPVNNGPVKVQSSGGVPIIVAERDAWLLNGAVRSFSEMMGLPGNQLATTYYFPWYNNLTMDTQLRFAVP